MSGKRKKVAAAALTALGTATGARLQHLHSIMLEREAIISSHERAILENKLEFLKKRNNFSSPKTRQIHQGKIVQAQYELFQARKNEGNAISKHNRATTHKARYAAVGAATVLAGIGTSLAIKKGIRLKTKKPEQRKDLKLQSTKSPKNRGKSGW